MVEFGLRIMGCDIMSVPGVPGDGQLAVIIAVNSGVIIIFISLVVFFF